MRAVPAYAAYGPHEQRRPLEFPRPGLRRDDDAVRVTHEGVDHSDLHAAEGLIPGAPTLGATPGITLGHCTGGWYR